MNLYDVTIIGGGPAGLTAAIYASRARLTTLLVESAAVPSQAALASDIENYPGFPDVLSGAELMDKFRKQAEKFGAEFKIGDARSIKENKHASERTWEIDLGEEKVLSLSVIVASGGRPKKLGLPGEDEFRGKGLSYCAVCDGVFFKGKRIAIVGGGDTAIEEALFLTNFAERVTVIHRRDRLRATKILQERAFANKKIEFLLETAITRISGRNRVENLRLKNMKDGKERDFPADGVFIFAGYIPNTDFLKGLVTLDGEGYVVTDAGLATSGEGIFAAGDARKKFLRQVVTAAGDGANAAFSARLYVEKLKGVAY